MTTDKQKCLEPLQIRIRLGERLFYKAKFNISYQFVGEHSPLCLISLENPTLSTKILTARLDIGKGIILDNIGLSQEDVDKIIAHINKHQQDTWREAARQKELKKAEEDANIFAMLDSVADNFEFVYGKSTQPMDDNYLLLIESLDYSKPNLNGDIFPIPAITEKK